jgi:molecular chaperone GrpE
MTDEAQPKDAGVLARLDDLVCEVRRQGRAAVAAQAAAESCLEAVEALRDHHGGGDDGAPSSVAEAALRERDERWLRALLAPLDALDRVLAQAEASSRRAAAAGRPRFWFFGRTAARDADTEALAEGLRVLRAQLGAALAELGAEVDRETGVAADPERHRVVEVRAAAAGEREGLVVEVARPGYALGGRVVREADVVATAARESTRR